MLSATVSLFRLRMDTFEYSFEQVEARDALFPPEIEDDGWILYHATTSIAELDVDRNGLRRSHSTFDCDVLKVVNIFRAMNWAGLSNAGYPVLRGFSFHRGDALYFREFSTRSLVYAERDFVGGESARGLHYALADLKDYLERAEIRKAHYDAQAVHCRDLVERGGAPTHVIRVDLGWLRSHLVPFDSLAESISNLRNNYRYGLVYAVRFDASDLPFLANNGGSGIAYCKDVPFSRFEAKARVHLEGHTLSMKPFSIERFEKIEARSGVVNSLRGSARTGRTAEEFADRERDCHVREFAGTDDAIEIAVRYGTADVKAMIESGNIVFNDCLY